MTSKPQRETQESQTPHDSTSLNDDVTRDNERHDVNGVGQKAKDDNREGVVYDSTFFRNRMKRRAIVVAGVVILGFGLGAVAKVSIDWATNNNKEITEKITPKDEKPDPDKSTEGGTPEIANQPKRDNQDKKINKPKKVTNMSGSSIKLEDVPFPDTLFNTGYNVFSSTDQLTDDKRAIASITDLVNTITESLSHANIDPNADTPEGAQNQSDVVIGVANNYLYSNTRITGNLAEGIQHGWTVPQDRIFVFDHNKNVKLVAVTLVTQNGKDAYLLTGYYDPVLDAIKPASGNLTKDGMMSVRS